MFDALEHKEVEIIILDTFNLAGEEMKRTLKSRKLKIADQIDTKSGYGIVLGGISRSMSHDIKSALLNKEDEITKFIEKFKQSLPVSTLIIMFTNLS